MKWKDVFQQGQREEKFGVFNNWHFKKWSLIPVTRLLQFPAFFCWYVTVGAGYKSCSNEDIQKQCKVGESLALCWSRSHPLYCRALQLRWLERWGRENAMDQTIWVLKHPPCTFVPVYAVLRCFRRRVISQTLLQDWVLILDFQFPGLPQAAINFCVWDKESAEAFKPTGIVGLEGIFH